MRSFYHPCLLICLLAFVSFTAHAQSSREGDKRKQLRVLNYNIHHANPPSKPGLIDLDAIARVIKDSKADVVAMQEVDNFTKRSGSINQTKEIARRAGMHYKFFKAIDHDGGDYGLAILSKKKLKDERLVRLPDKIAGEPRILAYATIKAGKQKFILANTHLEAGKGENRLVQMEKITEVLKDTQLPVILCGDFNSVAGSDVVNLLDQNFSRTCTENCPGTIPQINPKKTIDFIATKNLKWTLVQHQVINEPYASDHLPVLAVFSIE